jgi:hypothetical protein
VHHCGASATTRGGGQPLHPIFRLVQDELGIAADAAGRTLEIALQLGCTAATPWVAGSNQLGEPTAGIDRWVHRVMPGGGKSKERTQGPSSQVIGNQFTADWPLRVIAEGLCTRQPHNPHKPLKENL